ncbi:hypothetical protein GCM10027596_32500 [Nocardioides korecus]
MARDSQQDTRTVADFLAGLGARTPTPASGSVAALCAAQSAALVEMVARHCDQESLAARAHELVARSQRLASDDEAAFASVAAAWALPRGASHDAARSRAVEASLLAAALPQALVLEVAAEVLDLAERLGTSAWGGVRADLLAAADVARAAAVVARRNVESDLHGLPDTADRSRLLRRVGVTKESS